MSREERALSRTERKCRLPRIVGDDTTEWERQKCWRWLPRVVATTSVTSGATTPWHHDLTQWLSASSTPAA